MAEPSPPPAAPATLLLLRDERLFAPLALALFADRLELAAPAQRFAPSPARGAAWAKPAPGAPKKSAAAVSRFGAFEDSSDEDRSAW